MQKPPTDDRRRVDSAPPTGPAEGPASDDAPSGDPPVRPTDREARRVARLALGGPPAPPGPNGGAPPDAGPPVRPAGEGGEFSTWWVGGRHVLRLAPDRAASVRLGRELRLRDLVRRRVGVPVPTSVAAGTWRGSLVYTLDHRLLGESGEEAAVSAAGEPDLAALLSGLREVPVRDALALGLPRTPARSLEVLRADARRASDLLVSDREFDAAGPTRLTPRAMAQLAPRAGELVIHADLKGEHLRVTADGRVCGVLDWTDAAVGDPAEDIGGLAIAVGAPAAVRAATLAGYGARECLRGLWLARCDTVVRLADRLHGADDSPLPLLRRQLARAWEPILLELLSDDD
ncbi:aminoglycoside phosphotransferase family protein [Streptomyces sp. NPDC002490]|uniref:aminoglycoside phosphotransferase family protein n=1 Tax=Streptomyces sp. NPDC002490 TaxID=3154416 RepID=UPI0033220881